MEEKRERSNILRHFEAADVNLENKIYFKVHTTTTWHGILEQ